MTSAPISRNECIFCNKDYSASNSMNLHGGDCTRRVHRVCLQRFLMVAECFKYEGHFEDFPIFKQLKVDFPCPSCYQRVPINEDLAEKVGLYLTANPQKTGAISKRNMQEIVDVAEGEYGVLFKVYHISTVTAAVAMPIFYLALPDISMRKTAILSVGCNALLTCYIESKAALIRSRQRDLKKFEGPLFAKIEVQARIAKVALRSFLFIGALYYLFVHAKPKEYSIDKEMTLQEKIFLVTGLMVMQLLFSKPAKILERGMIEGSL